MYDVTNQVKTEFNVYGQSGVTLQTWQDMFVLTAEGVVRLPVAERYVLQGSAGTRTINATPELFSFAGGGWGHGVGMSQWGARGMAEQGHSHEEILLHYYQGVEVVNVLP